jgi:hypothetical protein
MDRRKALVAGGYELAIMKEFLAYPYHQEFGITYNDALAMPRDEWGLMVEAMAEKVSRRRKYDAEKAKMDEEAARIAQRDADRREADKERAERRALAQRT